MNFATDRVHHPAAFVRNQRKVKWLHKADVFYGDVSRSETLTGKTKGIDAVIVTIGSDGRERIGAREKIMAVCVIS